MEKITWNEIYGKEEVKKILDGYLYLVFTDEIRFLKWPLDKEDVKALGGKSCFLKWLLDEEDVEELRKKIDDDTRLLECRIFNEHMEYRVARTDLGRPWKERFADDNTEEYKHGFEESYYLDIDDKKSEEKQKGCKHNGSITVVATGGGKYELPLTEFKDMKIRIKNYVGYYEETGQAYVKDWRMAGFEKGEIEDGRL